MSTTLNTDLALRIGLAARTLPDMDSATLMHLFIDALGMPLSAEKFRNLDAAGLKRMLAAHDEQLNAALVEEALAYLQGERQVRLADEPQLDDYSEGDMPGSVRVAVASNTGENIDGHFGSCQRFLIYQVSSTEVRLIDIRGAEQAKEGESKNDARANLIKDCQIFFLISIGGPAAAKINRFGIHPIKVAAPRPARDEIYFLQQVLANTPPPWLAKVMAA